MQIEEVNINELTPYSNNPRNNDAAVDAVAASIKEFGFKVPIIIDKDNVIVAGHTRLKAALKIGLEKVPCIKADDLTPEQLKAFRLADNKVGELATWDFDKLEEELTELDSLNLDFEMSDFGFDVSENRGGDLENVIEDDYDEEPPEDPKAKLGDVYALGDHRLICGDSTDINVIDKLIDGAKINILFTDPPYGMNLDTDYSDMKNHLDFAKEKGFTGGKKYDKGIVDEFHPEMIQAAFTLNADEVFLWGADYYAELLPNKNDGAWLVWDKRANGNDDVEEDYSSDKMYGSCFELCWSMKKHKRDIARVKWAGVFGTEQEFDHKRHHPTQKPIKLSAWFLNRYSKAGDICADIFGGSGSTLIACEQLGRKCYMCELDPHYVDVIIDRWEKFTGKQAQLINE